MKLPVGRQWRAARSWVEYEVRVTRENQTDDCPYCGHLLLATYSYKTKAVMYSSTIAHQRILMFTPPQE